MRQTVVAIDPGVSGAVALLVRDSQAELPRVAAVQDLPTRIERLASRKLVLVDGPALALRLRALLMEHGQLSLDDMLAVEQVGSMPEDTPMTAFGLGRATGTAVAAAEIATGRQAVTITPQVWHRQVGRRRAREGERPKWPSIERVRELWSGQSWPKSKDGRAEAALIGLAAYTLLDGEQQVREASAP